MTTKLSTQDLPRAKTSPRRRPILIWLVPLITGVVAAWLVFQQVRQSGPTITIRFADGKGLQSGKTVVRFRGVEIGDVRSVQLTKDARFVEIKVHLVRAAAAFAREGSKFWVVRPDVAAGTLRGLDTIVGGPYIQVQPGTGPKQKEFTGLERGPIIAIQDGGLNLTFTWPQLGWLNPGSPIYYRGVEVGSVQDYNLGPSATNIIIHAHIRPEFAPLVRANSKFWNAGGIRLQVSLFGASVNAETLKSLLVGGIAFATPSTSGPPVSPDQIFALNEKPDEKWLKWAPEIELGSLTNSPAPTPVNDLKSLAPTSEHLNP